jgi:hypothetical protein
LAPILKMEMTSMKYVLLFLGVATLAFHAALSPAVAEMTDDEKAAAAIAILGIAALAHNKYHYDDGYVPATGESTAEFERGYRDGVHGYAYDSHNSTVDYAEGYQAGDSERENSMAHRKNAARNDQAPPMAIKGCAKIVGQNFAVGMNQVHIVKSQSPAKHEWKIEAAVGRKHMVCTMRDTGEVIDLRGGKM